MSNANIFDYVVVNGRLLPAAQAQTPLFNQAFLSSYGVYETVKIDRGRPFYLAEHMRRLINSAQMIEIDLGVSAELLCDWFKLLIEVDRQATWTLRALALGAVGNITRPIVAFEALPLATYPDSFYSDGAKAVLYEGQRAIPLCKSLNTLVNYMAGHKAKRAGALEGILHSNGHFTEGSRSSLFVVSRGKLLTAPQALVLPGITRDIVIHVMQETDYPVIEQPVPVELSQLDEVFITATSMHVMPITQIDGQKIGNGRVGPVTQLAMERFNARYNSYMAA